MQAVDSWVDVSGIISPPADGKSFGIYGTFASGSTITGHYIEIDKKSILTDLTAVFGGRQRTGCSDNGRFC